MDPQRESVDSPSLMYDLTFGFVKSEVMFAAVDLGIFNALDKGEATCAELSDRLEIPNVHLDKLLNTLCMLQLLTKQTREDEDVYSNTKTTSMYLVDSSPDSLEGLIKFNVMFKEITGRIKEAVRTGEQQITGKDNTIFYMLEKNPDMRKCFQGGMATISRTITFLVDVFDLQKFNFKTHVDIGGGTGTFARAMADGYPKHDVTVCDLERVCDTARDLPQNQASRIKFVPGDFFQGDMPNADLYSVCHVLHDWNDKKCHVILENIYNHLTPGGALLILDSVFYDDKVGPVRVNLTEIAQIVQHDGKHRTKAEFERLLIAHGFMDVQLHRYKGFGFYDAILARKPCE